MSASKEFRLPSEQVKTASALQLVVHFVGREPHLAQLKAKAFFGEGREISELLLHLTSRKRHSRGISAGRRITNRSPSADGKLLTKKSVRIEYPFALVKSTLILGVSPQLGNSPVPIAPETCGTVTESLTQRVVRAVGDLRP